MKRFMHGGLNDKDQEFVRNNITSRAARRELNAIIQTAVDEQNVEDLAFISEHHLVGPEYFLQLTTPELWDAVSSNYSDDSWKYVCTHIEENPSDLMFGYLSNTLTPNMFESILFSIHNPTTLRTFLKHGGNIHAMKYGYTFLTYPYPDGARSDALVLEAIAAGLDINREDNNDEMVPLISAAINNDTWFDLLIENGADVNKVNVRGLSVLEKILSSTFYDPENTKVIRFLERGAVLDPAKLPGDVSIPERNPYIKGSISILYMACMNGSTELFDYIFSHEDKFGKLIEFAPNGNLLLTYLLYRGDDERKLTVLLENSSDLDVQHHEEALIQRLIERISTPHNILPFLRKWATTVIDTAHTLSHLDRTSAVVGKSLPKGLPEVFYKAMPKGKLKHVDTDTIRNIAQNVLNKNTLKIALKLKKLVKQVEDENRRQKQARRDNRNERNERILMGDEDVRLPSDSPRRGSPRSEQFAARAVREETPRADNSTRKLSIDELRKRRVAMLDRRPSPRTSTEKSPRARESDRTTRKSPTD
jgi:ankyrin repeat protein